MRIEKSVRLGLVFVIFMITTGYANATAKDLAPPVNSAGNDRPAMTIGQAVILGIVEGVTEYLPVSSTGHLLLAERIMGIGQSETTSEEEKKRIKDAADAYAICIQAGAIIAVLGLYFRRVRQMLLGLTGRDPVGAKMLTNVMAGFLPAAVIALMFNEMIKSYLFGVWPVVIAWFVGGVAILVVSWSKPNKLGQGRGGILLDEMTWRMALIIGFAQCIAMWPGVSRSLVTIVGGMMVGLSLSAAVEYSFLLGVVTLGAATVYDTFKHGQIMLQTFDMLPVLIGLLFAFISAVISVKWMVAYLNRHGLAVFGYYRVVLALVTSIWIISFSG